MTPLPSYSLTIGGSKSKQLDALLVLKDVTAFASKTLTLNCFAAGFKLIFCFFLKSVNLNCFIMLSNNHSKETLT